MGKKSRLKKLRREQRQDSGDSSLWLRQMRHPLEGIPVEDIRKGMIDIGRRQAAAFAETTETIQRIVSEIDPLCLLGSLAAYGLSVGVREDGTILHRTGQEILPAHIELTQALCLRIPAEERSYAPALSGSVQSSIDTIIDWVEQFHTKRFVQMEKAANELERERLLIQERIRTATQSVRNWAYYDQVKRIGIELMAPLENRIEAKWGFTAGDLILIFDHLFYECQRRVNEHWDRLRVMMSAKTQRDTVEAYHVAFPDLNDTVEDFIVEMRERRANLRTVKLMLLSHSDLRLPDVYTFTADQVANAIGRPQQVVTRALDELSLKFGELRDENVEHFFMNNPVWTKPAIKLGEGFYFCAMPQSFFAFSFEILLTLVQHEESLRRAYDDRRSNYAEQETARLFASAFPGANMTPNFKWQTPDKSQEFESDLIVQVDSFLIIAEVKSGRVSPEARRGAEKSLGESINSLLVEPSLQSQRLEEAIRAAKCRESDYEEFRKAFPVDLGAIHRVLRLSVSLEDIGFLQTKVNGLKDAGYVPRDMLVVPSATIADLEVVFDILQTPAERIHYWLRRSELEGRTDYMADEIDLLGVYLKTGLNIGDLEFNDIHIVLLGESRVIDDYYEAKRHGIEVEMPRPRATAWWRAILNRMQERKPNRWTEAAAVLLCASHEQQIEIERRKQGLMADIKRNREKAIERNAVVFTPAKGRSEAIAVLALTDTQMSDREQKMENIAAQVFQNDAQVQQCAVIVLDVDQPMFPYSTLGWFLRPSETSAAAVG